MMHSKAFLVTTLAALAAWVALSTSAAAAVGPVDHFHNVFADSSNVCGIDVAETENVSGVFTIVGNGVEVNAYSVQNTWTNPLNGKSVDFHAAIENKDTFANPTDNGDGTISIFLKAAGMIQVKPPNGPPLQVSSGEVSAVLTLDATSFAFVSFRVLSAGGQSPNVDDCAAVVAALS
jgi:uncharacterized membrane protein